LDGRLSSIGIIVGHGGFSFRQSRVVVFVDEDSLIASLPVILDVNDASILGQQVLLKYKGLDLAVLEAEEVWKPNKVKDISPAEAIATPANTGTKERYTSG